MHKYPTHCGISYHSPRRSQYHWLYKKPLTRNGSYKIWFTTIKLKLVVILEANHRHTEYNNIKTHKLVYWWHTLCIIILEIARKLNNSADLGWDVRSPRQGWSQLLASPSFTRLHAAGRFFPGVRRSAGIDFGKVGQWQAMVAPIKGPLQFLKLSYLFLRSWWAQTNCDGPG